MAKKNDTTVAKRDVLAELLGSVSPKSKKFIKKVVKAAAADKVAAKKSVASKVATEKKPSTGRREPSTVYQPTQRIHVLKDRECRAGTKAEQCWVLVSKCKTVGDYLAARKKNNMGDGIGGWFGNFVKNQYISIR